jgi:hypothetical protein
MASGDTLSSNSEHAFVPEDDTMTAVFRSREQARGAIAALSDLDIRPDEVELVTGADHPVHDADSAGFKTDSPGIEGLAEIFHVVTETFSDDDEVYAEFDRVLSAGGALLTFWMAGRQDKRTGIASLLRAHGASSVYYWGGLATEQL